MAMILFFGFHPTSTWREALRRRDWSMFTHVEVWGIAETGLFFFLDPRCDRTRLHLTADPADFDERHARRLEVCRSVLRYRPNEARVGLPLHLTMNCAAICGHVAGHRAYTPRALHRILLANGAMERSPNGTQGRSRSEAVQAA